MTGRIRGLLLIATGLAVATVAAPGAIAKPPPVAAKGLPFGAGDAGTEGTIGPGSDARYVALPADRGTLVARVNSTDGTIEADRLLAGHFTVQAVAMDRSTTGISADGGTLVLVEPRTGYGRTTTDLAIVDARSLRLRRVVHLPGNFDLDAVSPSGRLVYLVQYTNPGDPTDYLVRAYDLSADRLLPHPVVDPSDRGEEMTGFPVTRATSPDGRWAYTLYDGGRGAPFVHALDTHRHTAVCVELDSIDLPRDLSTSRLAVSADGRRLTVLDGTAVPQPRPAAYVDSRTFVVTPAAPPAAPTSSTGDDAAGGGGPDWVLLAVIALVTTGAVGFTVRRRRRVAST